MHLCPRKRNSFLFLEISLQWQDNCPIYILWMPLAMPNPMHKCNSGEPLILTACLQGNTRNFCLGHSKIQEAWGRETPRHPDKVTESARLPQVPHVDAGGSRPQDPGLMPFNIMHSHPMDHRRTLLRFL